MRVSEQQVAQVIDRAVELGIDWFDTAEGYTTSEEKIGRALRDRDRASFKLFSKASGKTPELLREQVQRSFDRLQIDYIDLYQFHLVRSAEDWQEMKQAGTVAVLQEHKGKILHIGGSFHKPEAVEAAIEDDIIEVVQYPFNFVTEEECVAVLELCRKKQVGFIGMKPFGGGALYPAEVAIKFLMQYPDVAPNPGFETIEQVEQVVSIAEHTQTLTSDDKRKIAQVKAELGKTFCRMCEYCMPCPQKVEIPTLMRIKTFINRLSVERILESGIPKNMATVEQCDECGLCEDKCPYDLTIQEQIRLNADEFRRFKQDHRQ